MSSKKSTFKSRVGKGAVKNICYDLVDAIESLDTLIWESVHFLESDNDLNSNEAAEVVADILRLDSAKAGAMISLSLIDRRMAKPIMKDAKEGREIMMKIVTEQAENVCGQD
jgi:hypothetical protein